MAITSRVTGTVDASGRFAAESRVRGTGTVDGTTINCTATYEVTGQKKE